MVIVLYITSKEDLINEASKQLNGQDFIVRSILGLTREDEFIPTGFNDCWDLVNEQIERSYNVK